MLVGNKARVRVGRYSGCYEGITQPKTHKKSFRPLGQKCCATTCEGKVNVVALKTTKQCQASFPKLVVQISWK